MSWFNNVKKHVNPSDFLLLLLNYVKACEKIDVYNVEGFNILKEDVKNFLRSYTETSLGLIVDKRIENILDGITSGGISNSPQLRQKLVDLYNDFNELSKAVA